MSESIIINRICAWDPSRLKEIDEAKALFQKYQKLGYTIVDIAGDILERFIPGTGYFKVLAEKAKNSIMKILDDTGDTKITWTKENGPQAKKAKERFEDLLKKEYTAFSVDSKGNKKQKITEFDVDAEEIIMVPPTSRG